MPPCTLIPVEHWLAPQIELCDADERLSFHIQDALRYHGYDAVGGVVLGFRLLQRAIAQLSPQSPPQRRAFEVLTAFPGLGFRDCMELIIRCVSENRFQLDTGIRNPQVQEGVQGRLHFEFAYHGQRVVLSSMAGALSEEFVALGRASKQPGFSQQQRQAWRQAKFELANALLAARAEDVIRVL
ncbi:MAG: hypothetical protein Q4A28_08980 [Brachymonas sp.]|nr:hypothetical protein [Brachymonas sp.]